jgi:hypothetical protein
MPRGRGSKGSKPGACALVIHRNAEPTAIIDVDVDMAAQVDNTELDIDEAGHKRSGSPTTTTPAEGIPPLASRRKQEAAPKVKALRFPRFLVGSCMLFCLTRGSRLPPPLTGPKKSLCRS